jgi:hypothetical protein
MTFLFGTLYLVNTVAETFHISNKVVRELQLPMVLIVDQHRLGLGDIVVPGIVLAYAFKIDHFVSQMAPLRNGYFLAGLCGYVFGFYCAYIAAVHYQYDIFLS